MGRGFLLMFKSGHKILIQDVETMEEVLKDEYVIKRIITEGGLRFIDLDDIDEYKYK